MRFQTIPSRVLDEIQLVLSTPMVPVALWCWVRQDRPLTPQDLESTSHSVNFAFETDGIREQAAQGTSTEPLLVRELGSVSADTQMYACTFTVQLPAATRPKTPLGDGIDAYFFNELQVYDLNKAKAFPLAEYISTGTVTSLRLAINVLLRKPSSGGPSYYTLDLLCRSFFLEARDHVLSLGYVSPEHVKPGFDECVRQFAHSLDLVLEACPNGTPESNLVLPIRTSNPECPVTEPTNSFSVPTALLEACKRHGTCVPKHTGPKCQSHRADDDTDLLTSESSQDIARVLKSMRKEAQKTARHTYRYRPSSRLDKRKRLECTYVSGTYTPEECESIVRKLNLFTRDCAVFVNRVLSNICCAQFCVLYLGPLPLCYALHRFLLCLLPEHVRYLFRSRAAFLKREYCPGTCNGKQGALLSLEQRRLPSHSYLCTRLQADVTGIFPTAENICPHCQKEVFIPRLLRAASAQALSTDFATAYPYISQFCISTGRSICVVNLLGTTEGNCAFIVSAKPNPDLPRAQTKQIDEFFGQKCPATALYPIKDLYFYQEHTSTYYASLITKLAELPTSKRLVYLRSSLARISYYLISALEGQLRHCVPIWRTSQGRTELTYENARSVSRYLLLPITLAQVHTIRSLKCHLLSQLLRANSVYKPTGDELFSEQLHRYIVVNGIGTLGMHGGHLPVNEASKLAKICDGTFSNDEDDCLVRFRSTSFVVTSDLFPFGVVTVPEHGFLPKYLTDFTLSRPLQYNFLESFQ
ncbi:hypothetical protein GMRT_10195 [Giardia muris]|uniref:Uncharacterized protein n=1 Tax=Giardia muris TaxID=5742 RepID=A0A4Z1T1C7_GIAMU|nr:hypothetical protein GMRT_10195 [Giardia muris]|eukprot:TNJ26737.1 hypothetical protein GMRT_10195 [Giardia muris]